MTTQDPSLTTDSITLAARLCEGRPSIGQALQYAIELAESLNRLHESGRAHGAISPMSIAITPQGLELLPPPVPAAAFTPYTAPELLRGSEPNFLSDIFSFGAVVSELFTGLPNLHEATTTPTNPAVNRFLSSCLAQDPGARTPRIQKAIEQLHLLTSSVCRAEMQQMEARISSRLLTHEQAVIDLQRSFQETVTSLRIQLSAMTGEFTAAAARAGGAEGVARIDGGSAERIDAVERRVEEMRLHLGRFERDLAADLVDIENNLKRHDAAIESSRTAMSQTDDVVERMVEALESLQNTVLEQSENKNGQPSSAIN